MKSMRLIIALSVAAGAFTTGSAFADGLRLPGEISRVEHPRDMNLIQVEPSVIDEKYYVSGACERHQKIGTTLPFGSPIPDTEGPMPITIAPVSGASVSSASVSSSGSTAGANQPATGHSSTEQPKTAVPAKTCPARKQ